MPEVPVAGLVEEPTERRREMARALAVLYFTGPSIALLSLVTPHWPGVNERALLILIGSAYVVVGYLALAPVAPPAWSFQAFAAIGTVLISTAAYFAGGGTGTSVFALLYTWVVLYAFLFFSRPAAFAHLAFAGLAYGVVLAVVPGMGAPVASWLFAVGTAAAAGLVVGELAQRARRLALHDPLTGLPNRRLFADRVAMAIAAAERRGSKVALLMVDLDEFKEVNDTLGHHAGDRLLQGVARRLVGTLRATDTVARMGGDEFAVLLPDVTSSAAAHDKCERLRCDLQRAFGGGAGTEIRASVGLAVYPEDAATLEELVQAADRAMYAAKRSSSRGRLRLVDGRENARQAP